MATFLRSNRISIGTISTATRVGASGTAQGELCYDTDVKNILMYVDDTKGWQPIGSGFEVDATGGQTGTSGSTKWHKFNSPGTFTVNAGSGSLSYVAYGGGGGGSGGQFGNYFGPGGAAGVLRQGAFSFSPGDYPVTIGNGGGAGGASGRGGGGNSTTVGPITATAGNGGPNTSRGGNNADFSGASAGLPGAGGAGSGGNGSGTIGGAETTTSLDGTPLGRGRGGQANGGNQARGNRGDGGGGGPTNGPYGPGSGGVVIVAYTYP